MGIPFDQSVEKMNLTIHYNGTDYNWTEATSPANGPLVDSFIFGWNRGASRQTYQAVDVLKPGYSYWMYAYYDCFIYSNIDIIIKMGVENENIEKNFRKWK